MLELRVWIGLAVDLGAIAFGIAAAILWVQASLVKTRKQLTSISDASLDGPAGHY
jgi:hypothetical protein